MIVTVRVVCLTKLDLRIISSWMGWGVPLWRPGGWSFEIDRRLLFGFLDLLEVLSVKIRKG